MKKMFTVVLLTGALLTLCATGQALAAEYLHPKLKARQVGVRTIAVLPVKIDVQRSGVKGSQSMMRESEAIAGRVTSMVSNLLGSLGYTVVEDPIAPSGGSTSGDDAIEEKRAMRANLQSRFDALAQQLMAKPKDVTKGRFTLGDEVAGLVPEGTDAVVFMIGRGLVSTKAKSFLTGGLVGMALDQGTLQCDLVVVDARVGDVLFVARVTGKGDFVKAQGAQVEKPLSKSLKKMRERT